MTLCTNINGRHSLSTKRIATHSFHDHPADLQNGHVGLLALVALPHDGAHPLQTGTGAVQPGSLTLRATQFKTSSDLKITFISRSEAKRWSAGRATRLMARPHGPDGKGRLYIPF